MKRRAVMGAGALLLGAARSAGAQPSGALVAATPREDSAVVAEPGCGPVAGTRWDWHDGDGRPGSVCEFLGIPFAAPPVGALRFASPRPAAAWDNPRLATRPGAAPIQSLAGAAAWLYDGAQPQSENCLVLNVWTPSPEGRRPVMVWLHGGAWRTGHGAVAGTWGATLAERGDVVVVTVNYRLGALGWLAHPDLADPETGAAANWGLQDQVAALRWVQANIAAFGGDPGRVTLFGQSAGGSSTASIAQDPRSAGLLHRAIIESGSLHGAPGFPEMTTAAAYTEALAKRLDMDVGGLRRVDALRLHRTELELARDPAMMRSLGRPPVLPVLDGVVLQTWPRDGRLAPVPLLIGTTETEATFWFDLVGPDGAPVPGLRPPATDAELASMIRDLTAIYRPEATDRAASIAPAYAAAARRRGTPEGPLPLWIAAYTDIVFRLRARTAAQRHAEAGHPVWLYEFAHPLAAPAHGVPHTSEIPFVFGTYADPFFAAKLGAGPKEQAVSDAMLRAWARFAHDGDPGPGWARATAGALPVNVLGGGQGAHAVSAEVRGEELSAWG